MHYYARYSVSDWLDHEASELLKRRNTIRNLFSCNSGFLVALGLVASLVWWSPSIADEAIPVFGASIVSMTKTTAAVLPTNQSMMISELAENAETPPELHPSLCLNVDLGRHHLYVDDEVVLTGLIEGRIVHAEVGMYGPEEEGNYCGGTSMMVTTDLSELDDMKNDLYTGSLNITIAAE
jgi:hypothetical protein